MTASDVRLDDSAWSFELVSNRQGSQRAATNEEKCLPVRAGLCDRANKCGKCVMGRLCEVRADVEAFDTCSQHTQRDVATGPLSPGAGYLGPAIFARRTGAEFTLTNWGRVRTPARRFLWLTTSMPHVSAFADIEDLLIFHPGTWTRLPADSRPADLSEAIYQSSTDLAYNQRSVPQCVTCVARTIC